MSQQHQSNPKDIIPNKARDQFGKVQATASASASASTSTSSLTLHLERWQKTTPWCSQDDLDWNAATSTKKDWKWKNNWKKIWLLKTLYHFFEKVIQIFGVKKCWAHRKRAQARAQTTRSRCRSSRCRIRSDTTGCGSRPWPGLDSRTRRQPSRLGHWAWRTRLNERPPGCSGRRRPSLTPDPSSRATGSKFCSSFVTNFFIGPQHRT